jgi:hypothetical protein
MINEEDLEGGGRGLIEVGLLSRHTSEGTEQNHEKSQNIHFPGRDSNQVPPENTFRTLPLYRPAWYRLYYYIVCLMTLSQLHDSFSVE